LNSANLLGLQRDDVFATVAGEATKTIEVN
jgi:hypothetical protein